MTLRIVARSISDDWASGAMTESLLAAGAPLLHLGDHSIERSLVVGRHHAFEVLLEPKLLLPAQPGDDSAGHDGLYAGVFDRLGRHLQFFGAPLRMDHAGGRQAFDRVYPRPRQRL